MEFVERQRFRQLWLWALVLPGLLASAGAQWYALVRQMTFRQYVGTGAFAGAGVATLISLGILWLMLAAELRVEVREGELFVRFFPFLRRRIRYDEIRSAEVRRYNPLLEYGGWGVRYGRNGKAYNVSGNEGVQLEMTGGERLLLGSQRPDELAAAIRARMEGR